MSNPEGRWIWVGKEPADRIAQFESATPGALRLSADRICAALAPVASDSLLMTVVWGYAAGVLDLIAADSWLSRKQYVWAAPPGQLAALKADLEAAEAAPTTQPIRLHICRDRGDLIDIFAAFGLNLGLVVLDEDEKAVADIQRQRVRVGSRTFHRFDRTVHDLHLLAERLRHPIDAVPLARLKGLQRGRSALCVAAGPTLDRRMDFLRRAQHGAVVIAADLVAHRLEAQGVRVDYIVSVDTGDVIRQRCHTPLNPDAIAVLPLGSDRRMDAIFPRRSYCWVEPECSAVLSPEDSPPSGTNVGSAVLGMAYFLGCAEAVLVGHDLSFTPERLYSDCVDAKSTLEEASLRDFRARMFSVPGNGEPVMTNSQFAMAAEDMAALIGQHPGTTVYNPNVNDGIGARIGGCKALPEGWTPAALAVPPAPASERLPLRLSRPFAAELEDQCLRFRRIIEAALDDGRPLMEACNEAWTHTQDLPWAIHLAEPLLGGIEPFALAELTRPMHELQPGIMEDLAGFVRIALPRWFALCRQALDADLQPARPDDARTAEIMVRLFGSVPPPVRSSLQEALLPLYLSVWVDFSLWLPDLDPPLPSKLPEAVAVVAHMGTKVAPVLLDRILAMCAVEGTESAGLIVAQARQDGLLATGRLTAAAAGAGHPGPLGAAEAVLALREPEALEGLDPEAVLLAGVGWHYARIAALEAALRAGRTRPRLANAVLALLADGRLAADDAVVATAIELHPDTAQLLAVLGDRVGQTGERTRLAVTRRFMAIGEFANALTEVVDVRPLGPWGVEARALACVCMHRMGHPELVADVLASLPAPALASRVLYRYGSLLELPAGGVVDLLSGSGFASIPADVLVSVLDDALEAGLTDAQAGALRAMAERSRGAATAGEAPAYAGFLDALAAWEAMRGRTATA